MLRLCVCKQQTVNNKQHPSAELPRVPTATICTHRCEPAFLQYSGISTGTASFESVLLSCCNSPPRWSGRPRCRVVDVTHAASVLCLSHCAGTRRASRVRCVVVTHTASAAGSHPAGRRMLFLHRDKTRMTLHRAHRMGTSISRFCRVLHEQAFTCAGSRQQAAPHPDRCSLGSSKFQARSQLHTQR